jgi:hypothetical protein
VGAQRERTTMFGPSPNLRGIPVVTLRPGEEAEAVFAGGDNPGPGKRSCPLPYRYLRVRPPRGSGSVLLSAWLPYLDADLPSCTPISVTMVVPAAALGNA